MCKVFFGDDIKIALASKRWLASHQIKPPANFYLFMNKHIPSLFLSYCYSSRRKFYFLTHKPPKFLIFNLQCERKLCINFLTFWFPSHLPSRPLAPPRGGVPHNLKPLFCSNPFWLWAFLNAWCSKWNDRIKLFWSTLLTLWLLWVDKIFNKGALFLL